jgi:predicted RNA-binding protein with PIN domain
MHLLVDGYNVLGRGGTPGLDGESAREALIRDLMLYRQRKGHPVTVVFDGWRHGIGAETREHRAGVEVVFSKRGERADQVIERLAAEYGSDAAVVSSDHEIIASAKLYGALTLTASEFQAKLRGAGDVTRRTAMHDKDEGADEVGARRAPPKKGNPRKLPKALRKRNRRLRAF